MAEYKEDVRICHYCKKAIGKNDIVCKFCGYNSQTGTITGAPVQQTSGDSGKQAKAKKGIPDSVKVSLAVIIIIASATVLIARLFNGKKIINSIMSSITQFSEKLKPATPEEKKNSYSLKSKAKTNKAAEAAQAKRLSAHKAAEEQRKKAFILEGISFDPQGKNLATISGVVVCEGDSVRKAQVKKINQDSVELLVDGKIEVLRIGQSISR